MIFLIKYPFRKTPLIINGQLLVNRAEFSENPQLEQAEAQQQQQASGVSRIVV
jgi:hypothetical protein